MPSPAPTQTTRPDTSTGPVGAREHRGADPVRAPVGGGDPGGEQRQRRESEGRRSVPAHEQRGDSEKPSRRRRDPADRLYRQREVKAAAGTEEDRHPEEHAATFGGPRRIEMDAQACRPPQHVGSTP